METNKTQIKQYNEEEIRKIINDNVKLVYVDDGYEEFIARYEDLPDIIVDLNVKNGYSKNFQVYSFNNYFSEPLLTTSGYFLNKCDPNVRKDIIDRLVNLQQEVEQVKDYKIINEDLFDDIKILMEQEEMEK